MSIFSPLLIRSANPCSCLERIKYCFAISISPASLHCPACCLYVAMRCVKTEAGFGVEDEACGLTKLAGWGTGTNLLGVGVDVVFTGVTGEAALAGSATPLVVVVAAGIAAALDGAGEGIVVGLGVLVVVFGAAAACLLDMSA
jgi:hypothetical protein